MITTDQLKDIASRIQAIHNYLKIDEKELELREKELKTQDPGFWDDAKKAEGQMKEIRSLKFWIESYKGLKQAQEDIEVLVEFYKEDSSLEKEIDEQFKILLDQVESTELKNMLSGEEDRLSAVLQITSGAGGTESCDWASMLMRMYAMWGEKNGYKVKELDMQEGL